MTLKLFQKYSDYLESKMLEFSPLCLERLKKDSLFRGILSKVDSVHLDIMDGEFVPNLAFTAAEVNEFKCAVPKHVHIMSYSPLNYIQELHDVDSISFHYEAGDVLNVINKIREKNVKVGLVINPATPVRVLHEFIPLLDRVVIMAVEPGFSGQAYIDSVSDKIRELRDFSTVIEIAVDGGMNEETIAKVKSLGADSFVVCSVIAKADDVQGKIDTLKSIWNTN